MRCGCSTHSSADRLPFMRTRPSWHPPQPPRPPWQRRPLAHLLLSDAPRFRAGAAEPDLTTVLHKLLMEVAQDGQALVGDPVRSPLGTERDGLDSAEDHRVLPSGRRDVGRHAKCVSDRLILPLDTSPVRPRSGERFLSDVAPVFGAAQDEIHSPHQSFEIGQVELLKPVDSFRVSPPRVALLPPGT